MFSCKLIKISQAISTFSMKLYEIQLDCFKIWFNLFFSRKKILMSCGATMQTKDEI